MSTITDTKTVMTGEHSDGLMSTVRVDKNCRRHNGEIDVLCVTSSFKVSMVAVLLADIMALPSTRVEEP